MFYYYIVNGTRNPTDCIPRYNSNKYFYRLLYCTGKPGIQSQTNEVGSRGSLDTLLNLLGL